MKNVPALFDPKSVRAVSTANVVPFRPREVAAVAKSAWPAPTSTPAIPVSDRAGMEIPVPAPKASTVIGASIFGGPVTAGDPDAVTVRISPYTEKDPAPVPALEPEEGWLDVFGMKHGKHVPHSGRAGRGLFNAPVPVAGFGTFPLSTDAMAKSANTLRPQADLSASWANMSTTKKIAIGAGVLAVLGGAYYFMTKKS